VGGVVGGTDDQSDASAQEMTPDDRSLAGAQVLSLGAPKLAHSYWDPYIQVTSTFDSNPLTLSTAANNGWIVWTSPSAGLDIHRITGNSDFTAGYLVIGSITNASGVNDTVSQQLALSERFTLRRSVITLIDQLAQLPQSAFGYGGFGSSTTDLAGSVGLQSNFIPDQSILTARGTRISNAAVGEVNTFLTRRSSLTFVGSYSLLDYISNGLLNNHQIAFQGGYNHQLTPKDTIAVLYRFNAFRFSSIAQSINDHSVQFSYARRVTGRLAFRVAGGPDIAFSQTPIGSSVVSGVTTASSTGRFRQYFWDANAGLTYGWRRTTLAFQYDHSVTGGSGVLAGSLTDNFSGTLSHQISRTLSGTVTGGYSRNNGLAVTSTSSVKNATQIFHYWYVGAGLNRALGRSINIGVDYRFQTQDSNAAFCITAACQSSVREHLISLQLGWRPRPINF
jgi:hypothetical protein